MPGIEFLPLIAIAVFFWLLVIRPQSRRARELRTLQSSLNVGDEVMLTSGIFGRVVRLDEDHAYVEIAPGATVKVVRGAVGMNLAEQLPPTHDTHDTTGPDGARPEETN